VITGIDVSSYQSETYDLTKADFVFVKATQSTNYVNPRRAAQVARARSNKRVVGHYHYLTASPSVSAQMDYFLTHAAPQRGEVLAVDWEEAGVSCASKDAALRYLISRAGGRRVLLYCSQSYWQGRDTTSYAGDGLWVAQYNGKPGQPSIKADWLMHQYTSTPVDTSVARFGSRAEMAAWAAGEDTDVALTDSDINKIADAVYKRLFKTDGEWDAPSDSSTRETNPYWTLENILDATVNAARHASSRTDDIAALLGALGAGGLADQVAAELKKIHLSLGVTQED